MRNLTADKSEYTPHTRIKFTDVNITYQVRRDHRQGGMDRLS